MKHTAIHRSMTLLVLGFSLLATAARAEGYGDLRFGCQVTTTTDKQGYISIRAHSKEKAIAAAGRAQDVATRLGTREPAKEVVECVPIPGGHFTDAGFQIWVDEVLPQ